MNNGTNNFQNFIGIYLLQKTLRNASQSNRNNTAIYC